MSTEYVKRVADDGTIAEVYSKDGKLHRDDGPAVTERKPDGSITEKYYRDGQLFRPETPTPVVVEYNAAADSTREEYADNGHVYKSTTHYGPRSPMRNGFKQGPSSP